MTRLETIQKAASIIRHISPNADVILYGSQARGDADKDSDIDLLILVDGEKLSYNDITKITYPLYDLELTDNVAISPIVYTKKQWKNRPFRTPFYINIANEGIRL